MLLLFLLLALPPSSSHQIPSICTELLIHSPLPPIHPHSFNVAHHLTSNYHSTSAVITLRILTMSSLRLVSLIHSPSLKRNRRKIRALSPRWSIMCCFSLGLTLIELFYIFAGSICGANTPPGGEKSLTSCRISRGCCAPTVKATGTHFDSHWGDRTHSAGLLWLMISHMKEDFFSLSWCFASFRFLLFDYVAELLLLLQV